MSRLELAADRLKTALDALDAQLTEGAVVSADIGRLAARVAELEAERERLLAQLAELEGENAVLSGATEEVEQRLDGAIGEIRAALSRA